MEIPDTTDFTTTSELNRLAKIRFDARIKREMKRLSSKCQVDAALDKADNRREKIKKFQTFDLSYFNGRKYFGNNGSQSFLIF